MKEHLKKIIFFILNVVVVATTLLVYKNTEDARSRDLVSSVRAIIRAESIPASTSELGRKLADLELLKLVECVVLRSSIYGELYNTTFKKPCQSNFLDSFSRTLVAPFSTIDGNQYNLEFKMAKQKENIFFILLLTVLILILVNILLSYLWSNFEEKIKGLITAESINKELNLSINQKNELISEITLRYELEKKISDFANQVAHDIRSPITALNCLVSDLDEVAQEKKDFINQISSRISEISNDLLTNSKNLGSHIISKQSLAENHTVLPKSILLRVIREKQFEYKNRSSINFKLITDESNSECIGNTKELARILSNLINNSVESIVDSGEIILSGHEVDDFYVITIKDSGKGIPKEILSKIGHQRISIGKEKTSSGLGLFHAVNTIRLMTGKFNIMSEPGNGTKIEIILSKKASNVT